MNYSFLRIEKPPQGREGLGGRSDRDTALSEGRHDHPNDLANAPPHKDQTNDDRNGIGQDFNNSGNADLCGHSIDHAGEAGRGNSSRTRQNTSFLNFPFRVWMREPESNQYYSKTKAACYLYTIPPQREPKPSYLECNLKKLRNKPIKRFSVRFSPITSNK